MIETSNSMLRNATGLRKCRSGSFTRTFASGLSKKADEHCEHFGNVRAVVSDKKLSDIVSGLPEDFRAEVLTMRDYYAFGMEMPGAVYSAGAYRYGFNGMERDDEVKGGGMSYDFGARMYDPRVGRWWSCDPMESRRSWVSGYNFVQNNPIYRIDPNGMLDGGYYGSYGTKYHDDSEDKGSNLANDDKAFLTSPEIISSHTTNGVINWVGVRGDQGTKQLSLGQNDLNIVANTIANESQFEVYRDIFEPLALAGSIENFAQMRCMTMTEIVKEKGMFMGLSSNVNYNGNNEQEMMATIHALTGGYDFSNGAIKHDGVDVAEDGASHYRANGPGYFLSPDLIRLYKINLAYGGVKVSPTFTSGVKLATSANNKGSCMFSATAVHGGIIFWGPNNADFSFEKNLNTNPKYGPALLDMDGNVISKVRIYPNRPWGGRTY